MRKLTKNEIEKVVDAGYLYIPIEPYECDERYRHLLTEDGCGIVSPNKGFYDRLVDIDELIRAGRI